MNEDFVSFELAKKLKEKGFKEPCGYVYNYKRKELEYQKESKIWNNSEYWYAAPTIFQVLKWLREEKEWSIEIYPVGFGNWEFNCTNITTLEDRGLLGKWDSYESSALAGIEYVLDNLI